MFLRKLEKCSLNWFNVDPNDFTPTELMVYEMIENLRQEMTGRFEVRILDVEVRLDKSIKYSNHLRDKLEQNIQYSEYLMSKLEESYVKVDSHDEFIKMVKNVEFELEEEIKERKNGR